MNSQYAESVGFKPTCEFGNNITPSYCNMSQLGQAIDNLHNRENQLFQRIVDSIKFDDAYISKVLANELVHIKTIKSKLCVIKKGFETLSENA